MKRLMAIAAAAAIAVTAACSSSSSSSVKDPDTQKAAIEKDLGHAIPDWPTFSSTLVDICKMDDDTFDLTVAQSADNDSLEPLRIGVKHVCPKRSSEIDKAMKDSADAQEACDVPADQRSESQARIAEALDC